MQKVQPARKGSEHAQRHARCQGQPFQRTPQPRPAQEGHEEREHQALVAGEQQSLVKPAAQQPVDRLGEVLPQGQRRRIGRKERPRGRIGGQHALQRHDFDRVGPIGELVPGMHGLARVRYQRRQAQKHVDQRRRGKQPPQKRAQAASFRRQDQRGRQARGTQPQRRQRPRAQQARQRKGIHHQHNRARGQRHHFLQPSLKQLTKERASAHEQNQHHQRSHGNPSPFSLSYHPAHCPSTACTFQKLCYNEGTF